MFDPHRTRRSDYRYFTRKGQVLQASRVNTQPVIDQRLVPIYKQYLLNNALISPNPIFVPFKITGFRIDDVRYTIESPYYTDLTVNINFVADGQYGNYYIIFYKDTSGNYNLTTGTVASGKTFNYDVPNNVKLIWMYYQFNSPSEITAFSSWIKGICIGKDKTDLIIATGNNIALSDKIPITF